MIEQLRPVLVTTVPAQPERGVLYISVEYATTLHLCVCGCGHEVVLGISPRDWRLCWDGETVTLDPSVGNWSFPCQSHYFIRHNRIVRSGRWGDEQIARGRARYAAERQQATPSDESIDRVVVPVGSWLRRWMRKRLRR